MKNNIKIIMMIWKSIMILGIIAFMFFTIPSASADYVESEHSKSYNALYKKLDPKLEKICDKLEKKYGDKYERKLKFLVKKLEILKKSPKFSKPSKALLLQVIIDYLINELEEQEGEDLNNLMGWNSGHWGEVNWNWGNDSNGNNSNNNGNGTGAHNDSWSNNWNNIVDEDIKKSPEYKSFISKGWAHWDLNDAINKDVKELIKIKAQKKNWGKSYDAMYKTFFNGKEYAKGVDIEDMVLPGEAAFWMHRSEIQKMTQNIKSDRSANMWMYFMGWNIKINWKSYEVGKGWIDIRGNAWNEMKYHFLVNWEIKRGTEKYEDYKKDFLDFEMNWNKGIRDSWFRVKLEPLPLWKTFERKIENKEKFTAIELKRLFETALKMEWLEDKYKVIRQGDMGVPGYKVIRVGKKDYTGLPYASFKWTDDWTWITNKGWLDRASSWIAGYLFSRK